MWTAPHVPLPLRAGFESPAGPTPSPSAPPAPPWQGRSVASSKLWMLEFSAFLEQQQDPDTVGAGPGLAGSLTHSCSWRRLCLQLFPHLLLASCSGLLPHSTSGFPLVPLLLPSLPFHWPSLPLFLPSSTPPSSLLTPAPLFPSSPGMVDDPAPKPSLGSSVHPSSLGSPSAAPSLTCTLLSMPSALPLSPPAPSLPLWL